MHISLLDIYHHRQSPVHRLDPRVKILTSLLIILTTVMLPEGAWIAQGLLWCGIVVLALTARLGPFFTVRRSLVALPFLLAALPIPFLTPGPPLWVLPGLGWIVTSNGLIRFGTIILRTWIAVQAGVLLSATTETSDLLWGLGALKVPALLVSIVGFMIRYLFILADEALRMVRARTARSPGLPGVRRPGLNWQGRMTGMMVGSLFLRSLERSERVHAAMLSRGYDGEMRLLHRPSLKVQDMLIFSLIIVFLASLFTLSVWG